jgi:hypothetical protein
MYTGRSDGSVKDPPQGSRTPPMVQPANRGRSCSAPKRWGPCRSSTISWTGSASTRSSTPTSQRTTPDSVLDPAVVIGLLVRNLTIDHQPIYALAEWAAGFDPALFGMTAADVDGLNDDRTGRMLDRLFDTDRASLITRHRVGSGPASSTSTWTSSTTTRRPSRSRAATTKRPEPVATSQHPTITYGHNKDHRPRPETAVVCPHRVSRRRRPRRVPGRGRQHRR